jgi:transposase
MRGRKPCVLSVDPADVDRLHTTAHSDSFPWYQVRRARIVLALAAGQRKQDVAAQMECGVATIWRTCARYRREGLDGLLADGRDGHSGRLEQITPVQRAQIIELACLEPIAKGLHITHWSSQDLARQAVEDGIVSAISPATVRRLLHDVDLQPHRTRYWKTARLDARFKERAEQVLWCYGNAERLAEQGIWVVCVDEIPTFQVLERNPIRRAIPGSIEQQEFDYTRHGTVNMLVFLVVHTGLMELAFLAQNDNEHYLPELELYRQHHKELQGVFLIQDGGPSHIAGATQRYFAKNRAWWRPRYTPANASWLNQAEILIHAFKHYYLKRASWKTQEEFRTHVMASWPEYNHRSAHPFEWMWTNQKMRQWFAEHASAI